MGNEWKKVSIVSIQADKKGAIAIGPFGSRLKSDNYVESGVPVIRGTNISDGPSFKGEFVYITSEKADSLGSSNVYKDDLVFPHRGSIGEVGIIQMDDRYILSSSLMKLTVNKEQINPMYLYYFFKSHIGRHALLKNASQVGTPGIGQPLSSLKSIEFDKPPLEEQNKIVEILSSLNEKITLNRQINQTLEQMAQTLFTSWFVDFDPVIDNALDAGNPIPDELQHRADARKAVRQGQAAAEKGRDGFKPLPDDVRQLFPDAFEESELGWVPKGWEVWMIGDLCNELRRGISPKYVEEGGIQVINQKCIRNHEVSFKLTRRNNPELRKVEGREIQLGDVLINSTGVGTLGRIAQVTYLPEPTVVDSHVTLARVKNDMCPIFTFGQLMLSIESRVERLGEGSTGQTELSRKVLSEQQIVLPPIQIAKFTESTFKSFAEKKVANSNEVNSLTKLRDTLLPKLISGELRLDDVEAIITDEAVIA